MSTGTRIESLEAQVRTLKRMLFGVFGLVAIGIALATIGCDGQIETATETEQSSRPVKNMSHLYRITSDETLHDIKRTVEVVVDQPLTEEQLRGIANEIRESKATRYDRTFIGYRLAEQSVDMYWATTHYNPSLKVEIAGMTVGQQKQLGDMPISEDWDLIGKWLDLTPYVGGEIFIYIKNGKTYKRNAFLVGLVRDREVLVDSVRDREVVESTSPLGRRFDDVSGSKFGDHWIIDSMGNLQYWDEDGWISTANQK
jgi:hypothetical protein